MKSPHLTAIWLILLLGLLACSLQPTAATIPNTATDEARRIAREGTATYTPRPTFTPTSRATATPTITLTPLPQPTDTPTPTPSPLPTNTPTRVIKTALTVTPASNLTPQIAIAEPSDSAGSGLVNGHLVYVRAGPGTDFEIVGQAVLSQTVNIVGQDDEQAWWEICCLAGTDETGWITAEFVALIRPPEIDLRQTVVTTATLKAEPAAIALDSEAWLGLINGDLVNLRAGPGTEFSLVGRVVLSDTVEIVARNEDASWWQICCATEDEATAWVAAEFVTVDFAPQAVQPAVALAQTEAEAEQTDSTATEQGKAVTEQAEAIEVATPAAITSDSDKAKSRAAPAIANETIAAATPVPSSSPAALSLSDLPGSGGFNPSGAINPLTGLPLSPESLGRRPVIVCINNDAQARPQFGLSQADVMYEYLMEGYFITRFSGIFYGQTVAQIGPVRSARLINYYMGSLYDAPLLCSGASDQVRFLLKNQSPFPYLDVDLDDSSNTRYSISVGNSYRTRVRTSTAGIRQWLADWGEERPAGLRGFTFGPLPGGGNSATTIKIPYPSVVGSQVEYHYQADANRYLRFLGGGPHLDGNTGQQLSLDNVLVQYVNHEATDIVEDSLGSTSIRLNLFGSNRALLFRDGMVFAGSWQSASQGDTPHFFDQTGAEIPLKPGQTWISVVPDSYEVDYR